jgi:hypothetical protein
MPLFSAKPPAELFHGTPRKLEGKFIKAVTPVTCDGQTDGGPFAFAGVDYHHAAAYGLKDKRCHSSSICRVYDTSMVIIGRDASDYFEQLRDRKVYIAQVSPETFVSGVFAEKPKNGELPFEWVSNQDAKIMSVEKVTVDDVLRMGVQLFVFDMQTFQLFRSNKNWLDGVQTCIGEEPDAWINLRPEYDNASVHLKGLFGIGPERPQSKRSLHRRALRS